MIALRGANTVLNNSVEEIKKSSIELFDELVKKNNLDLSKVLTIIFSCTKDITKAYPGKFIRENFDVKHAAIMHFNEMEVEENLDSNIPMCIRVLVLADANLENKKFIYLNAAKNLRKDLFNE